jgi:hypothetical protein
VNGGLWHNHKATPRQEHLAFGKRRKQQRPTQADVIVQLLRDARSRGACLELPEIMAAGIAQHGARFNEIRRRGFIVQNELKHDPATGVVRSRYWLRFDPERDGSDDK